MKGMNARRILRQQDPRVARWNRMIREACEEGVNTNGVKFPNAGQLAVRVMVCSIAKEIRG